MALVLQMPFIGVLMRTLFFLFIALLFHFGVANTTPLHGSATQKVILQKAYNSISFSVPYGLGHRLIVKFPNSVARELFSAYVFGHSTSPIAKNQIRIAARLLRALDEHDSYTRKHSKRVGKYAREIARAMGLDSSEVKKIYLGAILHDLGKLGIEPHVINKPGRLNDTEFDQIRKHPQMGESFASPVETIAPLISVLLAHHERLDGRGYPMGKKSENIPLAARITAVADAFDAMTSYRSYKKAMTPSEAIKELQKGSGRQFDPTIVKIFAQIIDHNAQIQRAIRWAQFSK